jgi:hypothetical protein
MTNKKSPVALVQVLVEGYRSCRKTAFSPNSELSALIGINGAGKTNLLTAIRLLAVQSRRRYGVPTDKESSLNETTVTAWFLVDDVRIGYRIRLFLSVSSKNTDEVVAMSEEWNFQGITKSRLWRAIPASVLLGSSKDHDIRYVMDIERYERQLYESRKHSVANFANPGYFNDDVNTNEAVISSVSRVFYFCRGITYYGASQFTDPSRCPSSFEIESDGRLTDTYGISRAHAKFLHDLYSLRRDNLDLYEVYEQFISRNELGLISRLTWKEVQLSSNYKGFPTFVKQKSIVVNRAAIDHET